MQQMHEASKKYPYMSVFEEELVRLHDDLRNHPGKYARILEDWAKWYDRETSAVRLPSSDLLLREGSAVLQEAVSYLRSLKLGKLRSLEVSKALCFAGQLHCHAAGKLGLDSHNSPSLVTPERFQRILATAKVETLPFRSAARLSFDVQKGEMTGPSGRASAFLAKQDSVAENCCFGPLTPLEALLCLVIDDGVQDRGHRRNIFDVKHRLIGVAHGLHLYSGVMSVMNFCPKLEAEHPAIDTLHVQRRQRLTLQDFKEGSDVWDILKPRMCVGCGGICLGNSRAMRKYRGLDENGQEIPEAFCHPSCDLCPHCGKLLEDSGKNMAICFTRHGKTQRLHQCCIAAAFHMYCKVCRAESIENFLEYNDANRPALDNVKDLIQERMGRRKSALQEGDIVCKTCVRSMFEEYRLRVKGGEIGAAKSGPKTTAPPSASKDGYPSAAAPEVCHLCHKAILTGTRRVQMDSRWVHETCFSKSLEVPCAHCKKTIKAGDARISLGKKEIHKRCLEAFYAANPTAVSKFGSDPELHQCVHCQKVIEQGEGPTMFEGKWYHKVCCEAKFEKGYKGPSLNKVCAKCEKEIFISDAILVKEKWLHKRCWEDSQVCSCAFCGGLIVEVSQKAQMDGHVLHPHCVRLFLESGRPATSQQKQAAVAVSDATCSPLWVHRCFTQRGKAGTRAVERKVKRRSVTTVGRRSLSGPTGCNP
ncbi:unnamed protein product [Cladocopium goreaui]|uniref:Serine protease n=1 Tax=Cladocopium goreaui TaxID=2562237 RepID=A0A9P1GC79_9DINO|nr:unnamed protein product [Cladocopium goreaui]